MTAEQSRQHATRCSELAEKTTSPRFKKFFASEAQAWLRLAEQQAEAERRAAALMKRDEAKDAKDAKEVASVTFLGNAALGTWQIGTWLNQTAN